MGVRLMPSPDQSDDKGLAMPSHTPLPWTNEPGRFWVCTVGNNMEDPGVWSLALPPDGEPFPFGEKEADAAFIVRACNSHYELLEALQWLAREADKWSGAIEPPPPALANAWTAIAKVEGRS